MLSVTAVAIAASALLAACSGHGGATNSVIPSTTQSSHSGGVNPNAVTNIYGGGSTLASLLYRQWFDYFGVAMPPDPQGAPSGLPINASFQYYYGGIGSGAGRAAFLSQTPSTTTPQSAPIYCPGGVTTCWPYPNWHYSGSDATFSSIEIGCYDSGCTNVDGVPVINEALTVRGQYVQIPTLSTDITMAYNPTGQTVPLKGLALSRNSYCGIWQGAITNWSDPSITSDNGGKVVSSQPIIRVVRSDSSGTTALLTNALVSQCVNLSNSAYDWTGGTGGTVTWPNNTGNVQADSGSGGIVTGVTSTNGSIGYVGPSFVAPVVSGGLPTARLQNHNAYINNKLTFTVQSIKSTLAAFVGVNPPTLSDPYDLATVVPDPTATGAYPIVGYTWLEAYQCYNLKSEATGLSAFIKWYAKAGAIGSTPADVIVEAQGLAPLDATWKTSVRNISTHIVKGPVANVCTI
jgi:ABC-type phosphate transport system substrate-binding protein